ncbi:unnamed protein product [Heterobilharzia americana]|nr:unnamed protein product [Heterobilharzia americana]
MSSSSSSGNSIYDFTARDIDGNEVSLEKYRGHTRSAVKWNFSKFLVDREGQPVKRYSPTTAPLDIEGDILELLRKK